MARCPICDGDNKAGALSCAWCGVALTAAEGHGEGAGVVTLRPGTSLKGGQYVVDDVLSGIGAFGMTYRATTPAQPAPTGGRPSVVCVKELFPVSLVLRAGPSVIPVQGQEQAWSETKERFMREGGILVPFDHPGIVKVHELFEENGTVYLVQEFVAGQSLGDLVERGRLPEREAVTYVRAAAEALAVVHSAGVLHRDLKPDNIMVGDDGRVVLIDFGAAREFVAGRTKTMTRIFTPGYAPLEQCTLDRGRMGPQTDLYALGATLYHLLTGQAPVDALARVQGQPLRPPRALVPSVSARVDRAVMAAMEVHVGNRPRSAAEFLKGLGQAKESDGRTTPPPPGRSPVLTAEVSELDAGEVSRPGPARHSFRVQNVGKGPFSGWIEVSPGHDHWLTVAPDRLELRPMQARKVTVELRPPPGRPQQSFVAEVVIRDAEGVSLGVRVRARAPGPNLRLQGPVDPAQPGRPGVEMAFPPERWRRRWRATGGIRSEALTVTNDGSESVEVTVEEEPPVAWLQVRPAAFSLKPRKGRRVTLSVDARRALGGRTYETTVHLRSDAGALSLPVRMVLDGSADSLFGTGGNGHQPSQPAWGSPSWVTRPDPPSALGQVPSMAWMLPLSAFSFWAFTQEFFNVLSVPGLAVFTAHALVLLHAWSRSPGRWRAAGHSRFLWLVFLVVVPVVSASFYAFKVAPRLRR